ncbi:MAG: hypothetical protein ACXW6K_14645 [Candidatus Binatia bacterium]
MDLYMCHGLTLGVKLLGPDGVAHLEQLLEDLSWVRCDHAVSQPLLNLSVGLDSCKVEIPPTARELFRADDFCGMEIDEDFYLTDGSSTFHSRARTGEGDIFLSPSFSHKAPLLQRNFWAFALLKLLRNRSIFSLHAAAVTRNGLGVLIVGPPGSGKSTLAIGLIRRGWNYLSDDAVLLRENANGIEALACRKNFYVNADVAANYAELPLADEVPDSYGGTKRRLKIEEAYPAQFLEKCHPTVLLFPRIVAVRQSVLLPCDRITALRNLLAQSGSQLFDQNSMGKQLDLLARLLRQTTCYELKAGLDLYHDPAVCMQLLQKSQPEQQWLD